MREIKYNKLIRDRIPEIIIASGKQPVVKVVKENELEKLLSKKLLEETKEYMEAGTVEELADIVEVVYAILKQKGVSLELFENIRVKKVHEKGAFSDKLFLVKVIE